MWRDAAGQIGARGSVVQFHRLEVEGPCVCRIIRTPPSAVRFPSAPSSIIPYSDVYSHDVTALNSKLRSEVCTTFCKRQILDQMPSFTVLHMGPLWGRNCPFRTDFRLVAELFQAQTEALTRAFRLCAQFARATWRTRSTGQRRRCTGAEWARVMCRSPPNARHAKVGGAFAVKTQNWVPYDAFRLSNSMRKLGDVVMNQRPHGRTVSEMPSICAENNVARVAVKT
jgi:hypothetical protein